ncbi:MAG: YbaN family protein [Wenzhouxiangella sp.]
MRERAENQTDNQTDNRSAKRSSLPFLVLAYGCVGVGALGVVVPLLPTTPFLIVAAWAAPKGSPKLDRWLREHPRYGHMIAAWRHERAVPDRAKVLAVVLLMLSWLVLWLGGLGATGLTGLAVFFCVVAGFVLSRPRPSI